MRYDGQDLADTLGSTRSSQACSLDLRSQSSAHTDTQPRQPCWSRTAPPQDALQNVPAERLDITTHAVLSFTHRLNSAGAKEQTPWLAATVSQQGTLLGLQCQHHQTQKKQLTLPLSTAPLVEFHLQNSAAPYCRPLSRPSNPVVAGCTPTPTHTLYMA